MPRPEHRPDPLAVELSPQGNRRGTHLLRPSDRAAETEIERDTGDTSVTLDPSSRALTERD